MDKMTKEQAAQITKEHGEKGFYATRQTLLEQRVLCDALDVVVDGGVVARFQGTNNWASVTLTEPLVAVAGEVIAW